MSKPHPIQNRRLPRIEDVIRGSAVVMERACGKKNCRCLKGHKHRSLYISQYHKGGPRMAYIPKKNEKSVLRLVTNYKILKTAIQKASELNMSRLTLHRKEKRT
jgi:hypothetical protein